MIEIICQYPGQIVMGASAFIGAGIYATYSILEQKKDDVNFKFDLTKVIDTTWQSVAAGVLAGVAIGCSWTGIGVAMIAGIGIDKIANKLQIKEERVLNVIQWVTKWIKK